jgi:hypothetical protein
MLLSHSGLRHPSNPAPVLTENAGASLVVACRDGTVVVNSLKAGRNAIHLQCVQSKMVVVRDHHALENVPAFNRLRLQTQ